MPQDKKFSYIDDIYDEFKKREQSTIDMTRQNEQQTSHQRNIKRMNEKSRGVERGGMGEFTRQFGAGFIESATLAPTLWDKLGVPVSSLVESVEGEYEGDWGDLSGTGKAGFGLGAGAGALLPWGLAGKVVGGGLGLVGRGAALIGKNPWTKRAALRQIAAQTEKLTGKAAVKLSDDVLKGTVDAATDAVGKRGLASLVLGKGRGESFEVIAKSQIKANIAKDVGAESIDDVTNIAYEAVTSMNPKDAHAFLSSTLGRIPNLIRRGGIMGKGRGDMAGEFLAAYSFDALLGATMGAARYNMHHWDEHMKETGTEGWGTLSPYVNTIDTAKMLDEMQSEAFWLGFLGISRLVKGGTSGANVMGMKSKASQMSWNLLKAHAKDLKKLTPRELRGQLKLIDRISEGSLVHEGIPSITKAASKFDDLASVKKGLGKDIHWSDLMDEKDLVGALKGVRWQFTKKAPKFLFDEARKDLWGSLPRMMIGATTMNLPAIAQLHERTGGDIGATLKNAPYTWGESLPEMAANIFVGMVMTKKGRGMRLYDKPSSAMFQRGHPPQFIGGQASIFRKMLGSMETMGMSTKEIRGNHRAYNYSASQRYEEGMRNHALDGNPTYKKLQQILDSKGWDKESDSKVEGELPFKIAISEAIANEKNPNIRKQLQEQKAVAETIIAEMDVLSGSNYTSKYMTPGEALRWMQRIAKTRINGEVSSIETIRENLDVHAERVFGESASRAKGIQFKYIMNILRDMGLDSDVRVDKQGRIVLPGQIKLSIPSGEAGDAIVMKTNFMKVLQDGAKVGWIKFGDKKSDDYVASVEQTEKALKTHNEVLDEMHREVFGKDYTRDGEDYVGLFDDTIVSNPVWGLTNRHYANIKQGKNVIALLTGNVPSTDTAGGAEATRLLSDLQRALSAKNIEVTGWDAVKDSDYQTSESRNEASLWFSNVKKAFGLLNESPSQGTKEITATQLIALKTKMDSLVGDAFINPDAVNNLIGESGKIVEYAVMNMGIKGASFSSKVGILHLVKNNDISEGLNLPDATKVSELLSIKEKNGDISHEERIELESWYNKNILGAIEESRTSVIKIEATTIDDKAQEGWLPALQNAKKQFTHAEQKLDMMNMHGLVKSIDKTLASFGVGEDLMSQVRGLETAGIEATEGNKDLAEHIGKMNSLTTDLKFKIERALREGDVDMMKELSTRSPDLQLLMDKLMQTAPSSSHEAFLVELTKHLNDLDAFRDKKISEVEMDEMVEGRIASSATKGGKDKSENNDVVITASQYAMKYNIHPNVMMEIIKSTKSRFGVGQDLISEVRRTMPYLWTKSPKDMSAVEKNLVRSLNSLDNITKDLDSLQRDLAPTPKEVVEDLIPRLMLLAKAQSEQRQKVGLHQESGTLESDLKTDTFQLLRGLFNSTDVSVLEFVNGGFDLRRNTVSKSNNGFLGLQKLLGLQDGLYLMSNSAVVDKRKVNFIDSDNIKIIKKDLASGEGQISSQELQRLQASGDAGTKSMYQELSRLVSGDHNFQIIHLDENTNMVFINSVESRSRLASSFNKDGAVYDQLDKMYALDSNTNMKQNVLKIADGVANGDSKTIEQSILLARLMNDFSPEVAEYLSSRRIDFSEAKGLWKRLNLTESKSGIYGTKDNLDFALEAYKLFSKEGSEIHQKTLEVMESEFKTPFKTWVINDESGSHSQLDAYEVIVAKAGKELDSGVLTKEQFDSIEKDSRALQGRGVADADWYISRDRFLSILGLFGVRENMLITTEMGETSPSGVFRETYTIDGFRSGAIKPTVHLNNVEADGSMTLFIGKTAFKYDPSLDNLMSTKRINSLTFKSAAKIWTTVDKLDGGTIQSPNRDKWQKLPLTDDRRDFNDNWMSELDRHNADATIDIPWEAINFKQVSREHTSGVGANTFNHFSERGQAAAKEWADVDNRMNNFDGNFRLMINDPYARTDIVRQMLGFSIEQGDNTLARTGLDYIVEEGGVLTDSWQIPQIERAMISYYLNGGAIVNKQVYHSSMDVMTAAPSEYDSPIRIKTRKDGTLGGLPIQTQYGGKGISFFLGEKSFSLTGSQDMNIDSNGSVEVGQKQGSAFIFKHGYEQKLGTGQTERRQNISEEGIVYENVFGDKIINYRGLQITKEGGDVKVRRLSDSTKSEWKSIDFDTPWDRNGLMIDDVSFDKKFFVELYEQHAGSESEYSKTIGWVKDNLQFNVTNSDVVNHLKDKGLWLAAFSIRQPRNSPGDIILTKVEDVLDHRQGNVEKTNILDALKHHDADNDFDKNTTFTAAPDGIWTELGRLSGSKIWSSQADITKNIEHLMDRNNLMLDDNGMMSMQQGDVIEGALIRGRYVKMHQTLTYMMNMFGNKGTVLKGIYKNKEISIKWNDNPQAYLNTADSISHWVKTYIDLYKRTTRSQADSRNFIDNVQWDMYFGNADRPGLFSLVDHQGVAITDKWGGNSEYAPLKEAIAARLLNPINKFLTFNRGTADLGEGFSRQASLEQMANGYSTLIHSLDSNTSWNGVDSKSQNSKGWSSIDVMPGLDSARQYFARSNNPFDYGMRRLHELDRSKYADVDYNKDSIGSLVQTVESGKFDNIKDSQTEWNKSLQSALHHYVKSEGKIVEIVNLQRKIDAVKENIEYTQQKFGENFESFETSRDAKRLDLLEQARDELVAGVGFQRDYIVGRYSDVINTVKIKNELITEGKLTNHFPKTPIGVIIKGELSEVIMPGKSNRNSIPKGATVIESPRRYEAASLSAMGDRINFHMFAGRPSYHGEDGRREDMSMNDWKATKGIVYDIKKRFADIAKRYDDAPQNTVGTREAEKINAIHEVLTDPKWSSFSDRGMIGKWSMIQRLLVPELDRSVMEISPVVGIGQDVQIQPKVRMAFGGSIEKYLVTYLNQIRMGSYRDTGGKDVGFSTQNEATLLLEHYTQSKKQGLVELTNKFGDLEVLREGVFSNEIDVNRWHGFKEINLNQEVGQWSTDSRESTANASKVLMKYASGEILVDPFVLYRHSREMESVGIPRSQIFGKWVESKVQADFGKSTNMEFIHPLDAASERGRRFGDQSIEKEGIDGMIDRVFRCGGR
jgi:hypothetical protein